MKTLLISILHIMFLFLQSKDHVVIIVPKSRKKNKEKK